MRGIAVVGVGNALMGDDGLGVRAVEMLGQRGRLSGVELIDAGTAMIDMLPVMLDHSIVVVVDAVRGGGDPGTGYLIPADRIGDCAGAERFGHGTGVSDLLLMAEAIGERAEVVVFGLEPAEVRCSLDLSGPVAAALPTLVERIEEYVQQRALDCRQSIEVDAVSERAAG